MGLNIHIKDPGPGGQLVRHVCDVLRKEALTDLAYIAGSQPVLRAAADYAPQIPRACLGCQDDALRQIELAGQYDCRRIQFGRQVTREHVRLAHEKGLICNLFWADDPQDARAYVQNGIDVVLTNCAHGLIAAGFACATARRGAS